MRQRSNTPPRAQHRALLRSQPTFRDRARLALTTQQQTVVQECGECCEQLRPRRTKLRPLTYLRHTRDRLKTPGIPHLAPWLPEPQPHRFRRRRSLSPLRVSSLPNCGRELLRHQRAVHHRSHQKVQSSNSPPPHLKTPPPPLRGWSSAGRVERFAPQPQPPSDPPPMTWNW